MAEPWGALLSGSEASSGVSSGSESAGGAFSDEEVGFADDEVWGAGTWLDADVTCALVLGSTALSA
jgi:hypothetical protein